MEATMNPREFFTIMGAIGFMLMVAWFIKEVMT
jgi:hypothetical protein